VALEESEGFTNAGSGWGKDPVEAELMGDMADALARWIFANRRHQVDLAQANLGLGLVRTEIQDLRHFHRNRQDPTGRHHFARHSVFNEGVDEVPVGLNHNRIPWPTEVHHWKASGWAPSSTTIAANKLSKLGTLMSLESTID
jgi:hypothetical protein